MKIPDRWPQARGLHVEQTGRDERGTHPGEWDEPGNHSGAFGCGPRPRQDDRPEDVLPNVKCQTLVIRGENDPIGSQRWHEQIAQLLPQGRLLVMDSLAHTINLSAPERLSRAVRNFALECDRANSPAD